MAAHFDISVESLREWKRLYFDSKSGKFVGKKLDAKDQEIKALRKQVSELTQEREILKKAHFLKDRKMRLSLLKKLSKEFPIEKMAKIFDIPRSSYYLELPQYNVHCYAYLNFILISIYYLKVYRTLII